MLTRANALAAQFSAHAARPGRCGACSPIRRCSRRIAPCCPRRRHARRGDVDVALVVGLAKLADCTSLTEAEAMLTRQEKMAVLSDARGVDRPGGVGKDLTGRVTPPCQAGLSRALANDQTFSRHLTNSRAGAGRPK